jgi:hypothetical protein
VNLGGGTTGEGIEQLWRMGWLVSDLVRVDCGTPETTLVEWAGKEFIELDAEGSSRLYADARKVEGGVGTAGVGGAPKAEALPAGLQLLFHSFRYHVVHFVERVLRPSVTALHINHCRTGQPGWPLQESFRLHRRAYRIIAVHRGPPACERPSGVCCRD